MKRPFKSSAPVKPIIKIGERVFASSLVGTLFSPINGRTADGEYKRLKHSIVFHLSSGAPFAALVMNPAERPFFVTASKTDGVSRYVPTAKLRYMYSICDQDAELLGLPESLCERSAIAEAVASLFA